MSVVRDKILAEIELIVSNAGDRSAVMQLVADLQEAEPHP
jgi:hypothetical protein